MVLERENDESSLKIIVCLSSGIEGKEGKGKFHPLNLRRKTFYTEKSNRGKLVLCVHGNFQGFNVAPERREESYYGQKVR